ncbi:hypothetical protein SRHO_G00303700 [Serrasalmus rhombeus]
MTHHLKPRRARAEFFRRIACTPDKEITHPQLWAAEGEVSVPPLSHMLIGFIRLPHANGSALRGERVAPEAL